MKKKSFNSTLGDILGHCAGNSFILTNALPTDVLFVAHVALAAVAGGCRDAASVQTQVGEVSANVDGVVHGGRA